MNLGSRENCCRKKGVPAACLGYCKAQRGDNERAVMKEGNCEKWFEQIGECNKGTLNIVFMGKKYTIPQIRVWILVLLFYTLGSSIHTCCKAYGVPQDCLGICMGGCEDTSWEIYKLLPANNKCNMYELAGKQCCEGN